MTAAKKRSQREALLYHWNKGVKSVRELHAITKVPIRTIRDNVKKLKKTGTVAHARGNGRPKKLTASAARAIGQYIRRDPSISSKNISIKLANIGVEVSYKTIQRHLAETGYLYNLPRKTPMLTEAHKQARIEWAQKHLKDDWKKTFFSDETAFQLFRNTIKLWHKGLRPIRRIPKDRTKIKAWGGFFIGGKSSLHCFREIMNAEFYVGILREHIPMIEKMLGTQWRWQQDNDPKHTSHLAKNFLQENVPQVMGWPSNSPDLNPIENLWAIVKRNVEKRMPKNLRELERYMIEEWDKIPNSLLKDLVNSMNRRCREVIEKNGERISY
jgi:transposase